MRYSAVWLSALLCLRTELVSAEHATGQGKRQLLNADILGAQTYDYVIVGGGTAGLAIANRLSADAVSPIALQESQASMLNTLILHRVSPWPSLRLDRCIRSQIPC